MPEERRQPDRASLAEALAAELAASARDGVRRRGRARLVLAGGGTPAPAYRRLARQPLDWAAVTAMPGDERCVPPDDPASNEGMLRRELAREAAQAVRIRGLRGCDPQALAALETELAALGGPSDYVLLGMGLDGHTASLFPDAPELADALAPPPGRCAALVHPASADTARVTLTLPALLDTRAIGLLFAGDDKRAVYEHALAGDDAMEMPVRAVLHQRRVPVNVFWCPD